MKWGRAWFLLLVALATGAALRKVPASPSSPSQIELLRTPGGGIQPRAVADATGTIHVIYFTGEARGGDLYYVRRAPGATNFSTPIRVNSTFGSALAIGSVRGAQMALGRAGRVHVMWVGSQKARPRAGGGAIPVLYTRLNDAGTAFEPERNVVQFAVGLDGEAPSRRTLKAACTLCGTPIQERLAKLRHRCGWRDRAMRAKLLIGRSPRRRGYRALAVVAG